MTCHHKLLAKLSAEIPDPWTYLEIGCNEGDSLRAALSHQHPEAMTICDTWGPWAGGSGRRSHTHIEELLRSLKYKGGIDWQDGQSLVLIGELCSDRTQHGGYHMINVDGDHSYEGAAVDLLHCWPLLAKGGYLVLDDIIHPLHTYLLSLAIRFCGLIERDFHFLETKADFGVCAWQK